MASPGALRDGVSRTRGANDLSSPGSSGTVGVLRGTGHATRRGALLAQTLASVTALAGCGIGRGEPTPSAAIKPEAGKLQWMLWNPAANLALYEQVSRAFQEQQSAITLELVAVAGDAGYFDKLKTQLAAGQPVD